MSNHETQDSIKGATTTSEENFCRKGEDEIEQKNTHQNEENVEYNYENRTTLQENHPPTTTTEKNNFDNKLENDSLFEESPMSQENSLSNSSQCMESKNQNSSLNQKNQNPAPSKKKNKMSKKKQSISSKKVQSKSKENTRINSNLKDNSTKKKRKKRTQLVKVKKSQNPLHKNEFKVPKKASNDRLLKSINKISHQSFSSLKRGKVLMQGNCAYECILAQRADSTNPYSPKEKMRLVKMLRYLAVSIILHRVLTENGFKDLLLATAENSTNTVTSYLQEQIKTELGSSIRYGSNIELHSLGQSLNKRVIVLVEEESKEVGGSFGDETSNEILCMLNTRRQHMNPIFLEPNYTQRIEPDTVIQKLTHVLNQVFSAICDYEKEKDDHPKEEERIGSIEEIKSIYEKLAEFVESLEI
eukprot:gb/GECH01006740.1/.p1 GENE.gb/GECH01006740.1/~~gb/GECH01006740.1/.p1  ORF type:complete len:415 (+),score=104.29 gb/GECH01006740.1/:1-1245(+)